MMTNLYSSLEIEDSKYVLAGGEGGGGAKGEALWYPCTTT